MTSDKHDMQETSLLAYADILEGLGERQVTVYRAIRELGSCSNRMVSEQIDLPINCITGRTNELRKCGMIVEDKKSICPWGGKRVIFWKCVRRL